MASSPPELIKQILENILEDKSSLPERAKKSLEERIEEYRGLITKMAQRFVRNHRVEMEDLVQEAIIGLWLADQHFDPKRSDDFYQYAIVRMKGRMYEYCVGNESPIYVPTHIAKAATHVKKIRRTVLTDGNLGADSELIKEIIINFEHPKEAEMSEGAQSSLREIKRKLNNIATNSKLHYERLAQMAYDSLSFIVSDEILYKLPKDNPLIDDIISDRELGKKIEESLGEKKFMVLQLRTAGHTFKEIAQKLFEKGYTNSKGEQVTRQAVKSIYDEILEEIKRMRTYKKDFLK